MLLPTEFVAVSVGSPNCQGGPNPKIPTLSFINADLDHYSNGFDSVDYSGWTHSPAFVSCGAEPAHELRPAAEETNAGEWAGPALYNGIKPV